MVAPKINYDPLNRQLQRSLLIKFQTNILQCKTIDDRRKHSSRMTTVRCSGCRGCVSAPVHAGIPAWGMSAPVHAGIPVRGMSAPVHAGIPAQGGLPQCMLEYLPGGCLPQCILGTCPGVSAPVHAGIHTPPVDRILDTCL